jgi:hypothetical protein
MRKRIMSCLAGGIALAVALAAPAGAEVRVSGNTDRLVVAAKDASFTDILAALRATLRVDIAVKGAVTQQFSGTYSGSLRHVLARLLRGTDYVLNTAGGGLRIVLVGASSTKAAYVRAAEDEFHDNSPAMQALAAAAAGHDGSRATRIRDQRARMRGPEQGTDPY